MKKIIKRLMNPRGLMMFVGLSMILFLSGTQKVSAGEQQKIPYLIKVNRIYNTITVYEKDESGKYKVPIKAMICSVGQGGKTITGTFQTKVKYRWKELMGDVWGQYSTRIVGGILFHSVYYYEKDNPASLATKQFNKLGSAASHGCIRLTVEDAKWIYDNCVIGTTVIIYDDKKTPGPLGKPKVIRLPLTVRWDPTDPNVENPYKDKLPKITGLKDVTIAWGDDVDLSRGVKAKSSLGEDITSRISIDGEVNSYSSGEYEITYTITDALGRIGTKAITVTVEECTEIPVLEGISDKYVIEGTIIDEAFALTGVEAYCSNIKLEENVIEVTIESISEEEYYITYTINRGKKVIATEHASIYVDKEAPIFTGLTERFMELGEVPDKTYALSGVTVSDNYTNMVGYEITVTIEETQEGSYLVTYEAGDEAGNVKKEQVIFHN